MASWRSRQSPKGRDSNSGGSGGSGGLGEGTSDSDMEHMGLQTKRLKFLSRTRSRSSSPCSSSSPRTPGSWDSSPKAHGSSSGESHWGFSSPKAFSLSKSFSRRLGFRRSSSSNSNSGTNGASSGSRHAEKSSGDGNRDGNRTGTSEGDIEQRTIMLEKLPNDEEEREDYMTVVVGERSGRREKYVINRHLLSHHLFQTMMKCSEEMVGSPEFQSRALLFCDPALFLHLVDVVGADLALDQP
ncbi:unnamed protein product [Calypogeia fissa]